MLWMTGELGHLREVTTERSARLREPQRNSERNGEGRPGVMLELEDGLDASDVCLKCDCCLDSETSKEIGTMTKIEGDAKKSFSSFDERCPNVALV